MAWSYPILTAMKALAKYASDAVAAAAKVVYVGLTDEQANRERYAMACRLVLANPDAMKAAKDILSKAFVGFLVKLSPVASTLVGFAVEIAYQSFKAANASKEVIRLGYSGAKLPFVIDGVGHPVGSWDEGALPIPPESIVEVRDMAPGFEGAIVGFEQAEPGKGDVK